jgi:hypothetical protein
VHSVLAKRSHWARKLAHWKLPHVSWLGVLGPHGLKRLEMGGGAQAMNALICTGLVSDSTDAVDALVISTSGNAIIELFLRVASSATG